MKKRTLSIVLGTVLAAGVLAGCGSNAQGVQNTNAADAAGADRAATETNAAGADTAATDTTTEEANAAGAADVAGTDADAATTDAADGETEVAADGQLKSVLDKGTLTVAMEGNWQPWSYHDLQTNEVIGYDADVARAIGEKLGVTVEIVEAPWESLFAGLDDGRYDFVVNGVEITDERSAKYDFSDPYAYVHTALVVRDDNTEIKGFDDLAGKVTCNSIGSTYMELAESYGATANGVSTLDETVQNVVNGRADATLNSEDSILFYQSQNPDAPIKIIATTDEASSVAIPMRKGDDSASLRAAVNKALAELSADGTLTSLSEKYFGSDLSAND